MKIAIPCANGELCMHFGHCEEFAMVSVDPEDQSISGIEALTPPPHEPGILPAWLAKEGATHVIAGGMGMRAQQLFGQQGIQVLTGAPASTPKDLAMAYLNGTLEFGTNVCDH